MQVVDSEHLDATSQGEDGGMPPVVEAERADGASQEYELQHFTRLLWSLRDDFGTERHWQARLASLALDHADQGPWAFITGMEPVREAV